MKEKLERKEGKACDLVTDKKRANTSSEIYLRKTERKISAI